MKYTLAALCAFRDDIVSQMDEYMSDRSEKWQESAAGQNYEAWKSEWENAQIEPIEIEMPEEIARPDIDLSPLSDLSEVVDS